MKATFRKHLSNFNGDARLFAVEPPVTFGDDQKSGFVVVSKINSWAHETYIFPANEQGEVVDWCELDGSRKGEHSHEAVLRAAGYEVEAEPA